MEKKKILVVDDQPAVHVLLRKRLEKEGYDVVGAEDGEQGLWKVIEHKPDLVLTDVVMPKMDGIEFFKRLRDVDGGETVPVIVISKRALMKDCFDEDTVEGFFAKPFDMDLLTEKIASVFQKQKMLEDLEAIRKEKEEGLKEVSKQEAPQGRRRDICKRCGKAQAEQVEHCPHCGCSEFFIQEFYD